MKTYVAEEDAMKLSDRVRNAIANEGPRTNNADALAAEVAELEAELEVEMSEASLNDRLKHFEENQLSVGDKYGAEVLYRARMSIDALVRYVKAERALRNHAKATAGQQVFLSRQAHMTFQALSQELRDLIARDD